MGGRVKGQGNLSLGCSSLLKELLITVMSEVTVIVNACLITVISSDVHKPQLLTPAMLLTQKPWSLGPLPGSFTAQDLYARGRWRNFLQTSFAPDGGGSISTTCKQGPLVDITTGEDGRVRKLHSIGFDFLF